MLTIHYRPLMDYLDPIDGKGCEPILLKNFEHKKVYNLREAVSMIFDGEALSYSFQRPSSLFLGMIPFQAQVLWRDQNEVTLHISSGSCTFFLYNHLVENLVVTGLVKYRFIVFALDVDVTFHVFDAMKFSSSIKVSEMHDLMLNELKVLLEPHKHDDFKASEFISKKLRIYFKLNDKFQKYGIGITNLNVNVHRDTEKLKRD